MREDDCVVRSFGLMYTTTPRWLHNAIETRMYEADREAFDWLPREALKTRGRPASIRSGIPQAMLDA